MKNLAPIPEIEPQEFELQKEEARRQNTPAQQSIDIPDEVSKESVEVEREPESRLPTGLRSRPSLFNGDRRRPLRVRPRLRRPNPLRNQQQPQAIEEAFENDDDVTGDVDQDIEQIGAEMLKKLFNDSPKSRPLSDIIPDRQEAGKFKNDFGEFLKETEKTQRAKRKWR